MIRWSPFMEVVFYVGCLAQILYFAHPGTRMLGTHLLVYILLTPFFILFLAQRGRKRKLARAHLVAILWYLALTVLVLVVSLRGYQPWGWWLYLSLIAPGAAVSAVVLVSRIRDGLAARRAGH